MKINLKIKNSQVCSIGVAIILFITAIRYFKDFLLKSNTITAIVSLLGIVTIAYGTYYENKGKLKIGQLDFFWALVLFLYVIFRNPDYMWLNAWMSAVGIMVYFFISNPSRNLKYGFCILILFAFVTASVTWYSLIDYSGYSNLLDKLYRPSERESIQSWYWQGMYSGLTFHYSNNTFYMISGILILFANLITQKERNKVFRIILIGYLSITVMVVGKRGPFLFAIISLIITYLTLNVNKNKKIFKIFLFLLVLIIIVPIAIVKIPKIQSFFVRLFYINSGDYLNGRGVLYADALKMFFANPVIGRGYGSFFVLKHGENSGVHNDYLQFLAEWGIVGFLICIIAYSGSLYRSYKVYRKIFVLNNATSDEKMIATWSFVFQVFVFLYSFTGIPHYDWEIFVLFCIACAVPRNLIQNYSYVKLKNIK